MRGRSDFDRRQMLVLNYVYQPPIFRDSTSWLRHTLGGGWQISGTSTFMTRRPYTVTVSGDQARVGLTGIA